MIIPKSQGKQPYYDARKSEWGDIFPHEPKNPPQVRFQPELRSRKKLDFGNRGSKDAKGAKLAPNSYVHLAKELQHQKKKDRSLRRRLSAHEIADLE